MEEHGYGISEKRECLIFDCRRTRKPTCCYYCDIRPKCKRVCMNTPDKCGMNVTHAENRFSHRVVPEEEE